MKMTRKAVIVSSALLVLLFSSSRVACAAPPADACSLLTPAQVSAALGVAVGSGKAVGAPTCQWSESGKGMLGKSVELDIVGPMGNLTPVDRFNTIKTPLPVKGIVKTPISGLGDDAVYVTRNAIDASLAVKKG
jgi:hypothetical protein